MNLDPRIDALKAKHQALEQAIEEQETRPHPDDDEIHTLKKEKLRIKDELAELSTN